MKRTSIHARLVLALCLLILLFGVALGWLPTSGADSLQSLIMPSIALGALTMSTFARMTRTAVLDELSHDYVTAARARGLSTSTLSSALSKPLLRIRCSAAPMRRVPIPRDRSAG